MPILPPTTTVVSMATDPRAALDRLVAALEAHLGSAQRRRGDEDPAVESAYRALADAFETYDESLYAAYDEVTPFVLYDEDDEDADGDDEDDADEDDAALVRAVLDADALEDAEPDVGDPEDDLEDAGPGAQPAGTGAGPVGPAGHGG